MVNWAVIINPGTEPEPNATLANAFVIADFIIRDLRCDAVYRRESASDRDGWFGFVFFNSAGTIDVNIPGDEPSVVWEGRPWKSRRLYVGGSSWLYGYAINNIEEALDG